MVIKKRALYKLCRKSRPFQEKAAARKRTVRILFFMKSKSRNSVEADRTPKTEI